MLGVRRDGQQRLGHCPEEDAVDYPGILQRQAGDLLRQGKHHVEILYRQQLGLPIGQPLGAGRGLTLRATPVPTSNGELTITCLMGSNSLWGVEERLSGRSKLFSLIQAVLDGCRLPITNRPFCGWDMQIAMR